MLVCICKAISDQQIRNHIMDGADSLKKLQDVLGVSCCCGTCTSSVQDILREYEKRDCIKEMNADQYAF